MFAAAIFLLALTPQAPDCYSLEAYLQSMRQFPLQDVDLFTPEGKEAGRIVRLDYGASPPLLDLQGAHPAAISRLCLRRSDVEKLIVYRIVRIEHDFDGTACVSYEEGRAHSKLFQRTDHNQGQELQLHPYREREGRWSRIRAQSGFFHEALKFKCGIQVGVPELVALLDDSAAIDGRLVIRADSPWAEQKGFEQLSEFEWQGVRYLVGSGLPVE